MFNKVIIGILVFLLVLTGTLCAYAFNLVEEIDALSEQLIVSQEKTDALSERLVVSQREQAAQISALNDELATFSGETLARIDTLGDELRGVTTELGQSVINASKLYQEVSQGIVRISDGDETLGSGFAFGPDGHIVTPQHVVEGRAQIDVVLPDGSTSVATIIGISKHSDIAVLRLPQSLTITINI